MTETHTFDILLAMMRGLGKLGADHHVTESVYTIHGTQCMVDYDGRRYKISVEDVESVKEREAQLRAFMKSA